MKQRPQLGFDNAERMRALYFRPGHPSYEELAEQFGVSPKTVSHVICDRIWVKRARHYAGSVKPRAEPAPRQAKPNRGKFTSETGRAAGKKSKRRDAGRFAQHIELIPFTVSRAAPTAAREYRPAFGITRHRVKSGFKVDDSFM